MRIGVIINGISLKKSRFYNSLLPELKKHFEVDVYETISKNHAVELASKIVYKKYDLVIAAGGDGTVHQVANGLLAEISDWSKLPVFAVIPLGSGNDFARSVNSSLAINTKKIIDAIRIFQTTLIDIGEIECVTGPNSETRHSRYFLNVADVGMGPEVVEHVEKSGRAFGSAVAYYMAIIATFFSYKPTRLIAKSNDWQWDDDIRTFAIANGRYFGGGLCIAPEAMLDDKAFHVFAVGGVSVLDFVIQSFPLRMGKKVNHKKVKYFVGTEIRLSSEKPLRIEVDGEACGWLPATVKVSASKLKILKMG